MTSYLKAALWWTLLDALPAPHRLADVPKGYLPDFAADASAALYLALWLRAPWPQGEAAIAQLPHTAYSYAVDILHGPFPLGEPAIAKDACYAFHYALHVLHGRFRLGEPSLANSIDYSSKYAAGVLRGPFDACEPHLAANGSKYCIARYLTAIGVCQSGGWHHANWQQFAERWRVAVLEAHA